MKLFCVFLHTLASFVLLTSAAFADECPVSIEHLFLNSIGSTKGFAQYQVDVTADKPDLMAIRFTVVESGPIDDHTAFAPRVEFPNAKQLGANLLFPWPSPDILAITVKDVTLLAKRRTLTCPYQIIRPTLPAVVQASWRFDDSAVSAAPEMLASPIVGPDVVNGVSPSIDLKWVRGPEHPIASVAVGPDGKVLTAYMIDASSSSAVNRACLKAAHTSTFTQPTVNGSPVAMTVTIQYDFTPPDPLTQH